MTAVAGRDLPVVADVRGQDRAKAQLAHLEAQAIALVGPPGVGRRLLARWYAALLNCARRAAAAEAGERMDAPCGTCSSCVAVRGEHPDYREIAPADTTTTGRAKRQREYRIDQLVERRGAAEEPLSAWLAHRPRFERRVGVVDDAQVLNASAANAFLKTLEEPPSWATIVLIAPSLDALPRTIASRCTPVRCTPVATDAYRDLAPHPALDMGRIGPLERARHDPERLASAREGVERFVDALEGPLLDALEAADALEKIWTDHDAADVTDLLRAALRQRLPGHLPSALREVSRCEEAYERYASTTLATRVLALALRRLATGSDAGAGRGVTS